MGKLGMTSQHTHVRPLHVTGMRQSYWQILKPIVDIRNEPQSDRDSGAASDRKFGMRCMHTPFLMLQEVEGSECGGSPDTLG